MRRRGPLCYTRGLVSRGATVAYLCGCGLSLFVVSCAGGASVDGDAASFGPGGNESMTGTDGSMSGSNGNGNGPGSGDDDSVSSGQTEGTDSGPDDDCIDEDGDGFGEGCNAGGDCDDSDPEINPGQMELCDDIDQNCDNDPMAGCECPDDGVAGDCNAPYDLGALDPGGMTVGVVGNVPSEGGIDWYKISFPLADTRPGLGTPTLSFAINEGDAFVFDVVYDQCGGDGMPCEMGGNASGSAVGLTDWSFVDDDPGCCTPPMDSMVPWPSTVYIRVQRTTPGSSCAAYQLQASR